MKPPIRMLLVDSNDADRRLVLRTLREAGVPVIATEARTLAQAKDLILYDTFDCAIVEYHLPDGDALGLLHHPAPGGGPRPPIIVIAGEGDETAAVACMKAGAVDYLRKSRLTAQNLAETLRTTARQRRMEQQLADTRNHLATVIAHTPLVLWAADREGVITLLEGKGLETVGRKAGDRVGQSILELSAGNPATLELHRRALSGEAVSGDIASAGRMYESHWQPVRDPQGRPTGVVGVAIDITERKRAELALRESEDRFRALADDTPVMVWMLGPNKVCTYLNRAWCRFTGMPAEQGLDEGWTKYFHIDDLPSLRPAQQDFDARKPVRAEHRMLRHDGEYRWGLSSGVPRFAPDGTFLGYIGTTIDITEHRMAQELLRHSRDELEKRVEARTADLTAANERLREEIQRRNRTAKELRREYQGRLRSLASELASAEDRERRRIATGLHDHLGQQLALAKIKLGALEELPPSADRSHPLGEIRRLLDQSISYTRSLTFEIGSPILYELGIEAALESIAETFEEQHGVTTVFKQQGRRKMLDDNVKVVLFQAARELLFNVAKHAKASRVEILIRQVATRVRLTIEDDGMGFDPAAVDGRAAARRGFGLFSIRERIDHLGGRFEIDSRPGQGTRITLTAPAKIAKAVARNKSL